LVHTGNTEEEQYRNSSPAITAFAHDHAETLQSERKTELVKSITHLKREDKKT